MTLPEFAEGEGKWKKGWLAYSGEKDEILKIRETFGITNISSLMKPILFHPPFFIKYNHLVKKEIWEKALRISLDIKLNDELKFIRGILYLCSNKIKGKENINDYLKLAEIYKMLWLKERKPYGLEKIYSRFWYCAGQSKLDFPKIERKIARLRIRDSFEKIITPNAG